MSTLLAIAILALCLVITLGVVIFPVDFLFSLHLPRWVMLVTVLGLLSWFLSDP